MIMWGCPENRCRTVFEDFAFQDLSALSELTIGANPARIGTCSCDLIFKTNAFAGLQNLLTLNLKSVGSQGLDSALFKDLASLEKIDLRYNRIQSVPSSFFSNQRNLRKLDLSSNSIKVIEPNAFLNLGQLKSLDLSNSGGPLELNEGTFAGLTSLEHLDLFYTGSTLKGRAFKNLQTLKTLDISTNPITSEQREEIKQDLPNTQIKF
jgi:Leucine-rich repeat (LRR) protein